jgi:hypothetical protein
MSVLNDMLVVEATRVHNEQSDSVMHLGTMMTVVLDWHGKLLACGYPGKKWCIVIERRDDFQDAVIRMLQPIDSGGIKHLLPLIALMNQKREWNDEHTLRGLISELIRFGDLM